MFAPVILKNAPLKRDCMAVSSIDALNNGMNYRKKDSSGRGACIIVDG
jgi:hypothetical protein